MTKLDKHTMTIGDVSRAIGRSVTRVQQLDEQLRPTRNPSGQRRYDPAVVEKYLLDRTKTARP
jgi:DNA-binding transcriptional MerR regulator